MYFCSNCSYILDITKSTLLTDTPKIPIIKITDLFKLLDNNEDMSKYKPEFTKDDLFKHKKAKDYDKNILNNLFEDNIITNAEFICNNCNYVKKINETTLLYQINLEDKITKIYNIEENKLFVQDPLLPHTRDYICKNKDCNTHKNSELKNAKWFRPIQNSYMTYYVCCDCGIVWNIS
jgi:DNA-directed RNA polymerase subunit M/transcription elongation factor TFIIS